MGSPQAFSLSDLDLLEALAKEEARESFWAFRQYMNPTMKVGWWQEQVCGHLQRFYDRLILGMRPRMVIQAPPQHGKSEIITDFCAWLPGKQPHLRNIYASFSDRLGVRANLRMQRMLDSNKYRELFPHIYLAPNGVNSSGYTRNRDLLEFMHQEGYFRNTTVRGSVTGEGLDIGVIDDPIKGRAEANSETIRNAAWDWLTDDFFTRFSEEAGLLIILTRWHVDDPVGRLINEDPELEVHSYPAIAIEDEEFRKEGEALFPEHKSLAFLLERKSILDEPSWESLYQQSPYIRSGGMFPKDKFIFTESEPSSGDILITVRYWDKAGTKEGKGARTAGVKMSKLKNGSFFIHDVQFGRWSTLERETRIKQVAKTDGFFCTVYVEQEPGSGGKESAESTIRMNAGSVVYADKPTGAKEIRAEPYSAQVQGSNVLVKTASWNREFLTEHEQFPNGKTKDIVDACAGAFAKVAGGSTYTLENVG